MSSISSAEAERLEANIADMREMMRDLLTLQEKQQESLVKIAECLEKISQAALRTRDGTTGIVTFEAHIVPTPNHAAAHTRGDA